MFLLERNTQVICIDTTSYFRNLKVDHALCPAILHATKNYYHLHADSRRVQGRQSHRHAISMSASSIKGLTTKPHGCHTPF